MIPWRPSTGIIAICLTTLLAHGLWLLNDGVFYDAWLEWASGTYGKWEMLQRFFDDSGMPQVGWFHRVFMRSPSPPLTYALLGWGCWLTVGLLLRRLAMRWLGLDDLEASASAMLLVSSRIACIGVSFIHAPYFVAMASLFGLAHLLTIEADAQVINGSWWRHRLGIHALMLLCSMMPSCYTAIYLFIACAGLHGLVTRGWRHAMFTRIDLAIIPLATFWLQRKLAPTANGYAGNNTMNRHKLWRRLPKVMTNTFEATIVDVVRQAWQSPVTWWMLGGAIALVCCIVMMRRRPFPKPRVRWKATALLMFMVAWTAAAIVPYALVKKMAVMASTFTWRHGLLVALLPSLGLLLLMVLVSRWSWLRVVVIVAVMGLVAGQSYTSLHIHGQWLSRAAKQRAAVEHVRVHPPTELPEVVWVDDYVPLPHAAKVVSYELTGWVSAVLGTLHAGALANASKSNVDAYRIGYFWYYLLPQFRGDGPHATLTIRARGPKMSKSNLDQVGFDYAKARLTGSTLAWLEQRFAVSLLPTSPPNNWAEKLEEARQHKVADVESQ
jgi:hypothetical protein